MGSLKVLYQRKGIDTIEIMLQAERTKLERRREIYELLSTPEWETRNYLQSISDRITPKSYDINDITSTAYRRGINKRTDRVIEVIGEDTELIDGEHKLIPGKQIHSYLYVCNNKGLKKIKKYCEERNTQIEQGIERKIRNAFF